MMVEPSGYGKLGFYKMPSAYYDALADFVAFGVGMVCIEPDGTATHVPPEEMQKPDEGQE
jgi:hypothetical protein